MTLEELATCQKWGLKDVPMSIQEHRNYFCALLGRTISCEEAWEVIRSQSQDLIQEDIEDA